MNNYQILGLSPTATIAEVKAKFKKLSLIHHPDRGGNTDTFIKVRQAYEAILEPKNYSSNITEDMFRESFANLKREQEAIKRREYLRRQAEEFLESQRRGRCIFGRISIVSNKYRFEITTENIYKVQFYNSSNSTIVNFIINKESGTNYFTLTKEYIKEANYLISITLYDVLGHHIKKEFKLKGEDKVVELTLSQKISKKFNNLLTFLSK